VPRFAIDPGTSLAARGGTVEVTMASKSPPLPSSDCGQAQTIIPVVTEELAVDKREVETGRVRVTKSVREHEQSIQQPLLHDEVEIERVPINRMIEQPMEPRYEGDVLVIPMIEEVAVVHKQLVLKEELRIRKRSVETVHEARVVLREEQANIERIARENLKGDS
jgi:uncharacterized protein (TIGR02271 family)